MSKFSFNLEGDSVEDLKAIMNPKEVEKVVEKVVEREVEKVVETHRTHCPICDNDTISWLDTTADYPMAGIDGKERLIQQGNCTLCGYGVQRGRRGSDE